MSACAGQGSRPCPAPIGGPGAIVLRPANLSDEDALRACAVAAFSPYVAEIGQAPAPMNADLTAHIARGDVLVVCYPGEAPLGYQVAYPQGGAMLLDTVAVLPAHSGKGIGRALIAACEEAARDADLRSVRLYTNARMASNLVLYPRLGYRECGRVIEQGFNRVYFEKLLDQSGSPQS